MPRREPPDEPSLFDLPLEPPGAAEPPPHTPSRGRSPQTRQEPREPKPAAAAGSSSLPDLPLELFEPAPEPPSAPRAVRRPERPEPAAREAAAVGPAFGPAPADRATGVPASPGARLAAGAADLLVHAAVAVTVLVGARLLGTRPSLSDGPAVALFLLSFSFLYTVLPLAFWGQTLGMTWAGIASRSLDGEPLAFDQTARRWLGALLTLITLGVPLFLGPPGRSLSDLLSGSVTWAEGG
jgi:uncharacterized RDD family membrane protein YckC